MVLTYGHVVPLPGQYFAQEIVAVCVRDSFSQENNVQISKGICEHLLREGRMDVAETLINVGPTELVFYTTFCEEGEGLRMDLLVFAASVCCYVALQESGLSHHETFVSMFTEIHQIAQSLRNRDVEHALE